MAKGLRSLQLSLNEFIPKLELEKNTVSKVAYSRARRKLKHTAFIELNQKAVVTTIYEDGDYKTYQGLRILAIDGSKIQLPTNNETIEEFGTLSYAVHNNSQQIRPSITGEHSYALASVLYDVLNQVALDAKLGPAHSYEVDLAALHLSHTKDGDLTIYDRGYSSYRMMALASSAKGDFLIRCHGNSFEIVNKMLRGEGLDDVTCEVVANQKFISRESNQGLPSKLTVRFIRATLDDGSYEVLATSLTNQQKYTRADFKKLYYLRWGIETFYGILKTRLNLENFSGLSPEAIRQDFYATIFLTGAETILTMDAELQLQKQSSGQTKKVNKAISFNAIKYRAFELFYSRKTDEQKLEALTELFLTSPISIRPDRKPPRRKSSSHRILGFWKRQRKMVF